MDIKIDFSGLAQAIIDGIRSLVESWLSALPQMIVDWIADQMMKLWNGIWFSNFNLLATPFALTIDFPPYMVLSHQLGMVAYSIAALSVALLAMRILWSNISGSGSMRSDAVNGVLFGVFLASLAALIVGQAFTLVGIASDAIGRQDYRPSFDPHSLLTIGPDLVLGLFAIVVLIVYGWRLMVRGAYRVVLIGFLAPFAPVCSALWAIPQLRWISILYWVTWGGWMAGGFLAIGAVSLAVQLALFGGEGLLLKLVFGVALLQLAYDLMSILSRGAAGGIQVGSPFGAMLGMAGAWTMGAVAGGAAGAAAGGAGGGGAVGSTGIGNGGAAAAIAEPVGYGY